MCKDITLCVKAEEWSRKNYHLSIPLIVAMEIQENTQQPRKLLMVMSRNPRDTLTAPSRSSSQGLSYVVDVPLSMSAYCVDSCSCVDAASCETWSMLMLSLVVSRTYHNAALCASKDKSTTGGFEARKWYGYHF
jgi:hypothetical protein